jgi:UDP-GlcNAc:undecaprenyl-phosphate GlcNAc-1-phosphate transferase
LLAQKTSPTNYFNIAGLISAIVIGMCVGFLPHNWRPAKIFMGDSGAMLLGLLMATSALTVTGQIDPHMVGRDDLLPAFIPLILPLAILILPLLDFSLAVLRRLRAGKSPFAADRQHLHHRLQDFGHGHVGSVLVFYIWTALISVSCLLFFFWPWQAIVAFDVVGVILATTYTVWPIIRKSQKAKLNA